MSVVIVMCYQAMRGGGQNSKCFEPKSFLILSGRFFLLVEKVLKFDGLIPTVADQTKRIYVEIKSLPRHFSDLDRANSD
jgi:hypothetical protein